MREIINSISTWFKTEREDIFEGYDDEEILKFVNNKLGIGIQSIEDYIIESRMDLAIKEICDMIVFSTLGSTILGDVKMKAFSNTLRSSYYNVVMIVSYSGRTGCIRDFITFLRKDIQQVLRNEPSGHIYSLPISNLVRLYDYINRKYNIDVSLQESLEESFNRIKEKL